jgi:hypothetical protein
MDEPRADSSRGARVFFAGRRAAAVFAAAGRRAIASARRAVAAAVLAAIAATAAVAALSLVGCARRAPEAPKIDYPYLADSSRTFYASASGLSDLPPRDGAPGAADEGSPSARAPNASVLSSDGVTIVAAINGWGLARIESSTGGRGGAAPTADGRASAEAAAGAAATGAEAAARVAYRIEGRPLPSLFTGLTAAGAWPLSGGFLVQLFRDPFAHLASPSADPRSEALGGRLVFLPAGDGDALSPEPFAAETAGGYELFALLPSGGRWFAALRKEKDERVEQKFLSLDDPLAGVGRAGTSGVGLPAEKPDVMAAVVVGIKRAQFEEMLKPKALASLGGGEGERLRTAVRILGKGPWLVRLRTSKGGDGWYLSSGDAEEASPLYAWSGPTGTLALRSDGWLSLASEGSASKLVSLGEPLPGAVYTALASADGIVAAAWETGEFPNIVSAGLVVAPLPR